MKQTVAHPRLGESEILASPIRMEPFARAVGPATHEQGADTEAVLLESGFDAAEVTALRAEGAIPAG